MPEIQDGKNVADFIDPDIVARLEELEAEEERLEAAGFYDSESEEDSDEDAIRTTAEAIRDKKANMRMLNQQRQHQQNRPVIPRNAQHRTLSEMTSKLKEAGYDASDLEERAKLLAKARGLVGKKRSAGDMDVDAEEDDEAAWASDNGDESMDVEDGTGSARKKQRTSAVAAKSSKRVPKTDRQIAGLGSAEASRGGSRIWLVRVTDYVTFVSTGSCKGCATQAIVSAWTEHACQGIRVGSTHSYQDAQAFVLGQARCWQGQPSLVSHRQTCGLLLRPCCFFLLPFLAVSAFFASCRLAVLSCISFSWCNSLHTSVFLMNQCRCEIYS